MIKDYETISIAKYMLEYAQLLQVEAERLDHLGVVPEPNLFDKAQEVYFLAEQINRIEATGTCILSMANT